MINAIFQLKPFPQLRGTNLYPEEVYITPFPQEYLSTFVIYKGNTVPLQHVSRFKRQCGITLTRRPLPEKQFSLSLRGITYNCCRALHGMVILTWAMMEKQLLQDQLTYWHTLEFLRNEAIHNIRREASPLGSLSDDHNDANLGIITDDGNNGEVALVSSKAWPLELGYKPIYQVQTLSNQAPPRKPISVCRQKKQLSKELAKPPA